MCNTASLLLLLLALALLACALTLACVRHKWWWLALWGLGLSITLRRVRVFRVLVATAAAGVARVAVLAGVTTPCQVLCQASPLSRHFCRIVWLGLAAVLIHLAAVIPPCLGGSAGVDPALPRTRNTFEKNKLWKICIRNFTENRKLLIHWSYFS